MIKYLECNGDLIKNKEVIELGSGTGIAGIAAALLGIFIPSHINELKL